MAITINQEPQLFTPVYNQILIRAESDQTAQPNFRFRVEIFKNLNLFSDGVLIYTGFFLPRPGTIEAVIDVHRICETAIEQSLIEDFVNKNYGTQGHGFQSHQDLDGFRIKITEEFGTPRADGDTTNIDFYGFNSALKEQAFVDWDHAKYLHVLNDDTTLFLTNSTTPNVELDDSAMLSWLQDDSANSAFAVEEVEIKTFDVNNVLLKTVTIVAGQVDALGVDWTDFYRSILIGPDDLNNSTLSSGAQPVIEANTDHYTVQLKDINTDPSSELRRYNIVDLCNRAITRRLVFLNKLSGFDAYTFALEGIETVSIDRKFTNRTGYLFDSVLTNLQKESGKIPYNIEYRDEMKVTSDWLTTEEIIWLEEFVTSSEILLLKDGKFQSVTIKNMPRFEKKITQRDKVFNLVVELEFAFKSFSQRA